MLDEKDLFNDDSDCEYTCYECGEVMELDGDVLICPSCGHSVTIDDYCTEEEDYGDIYRTGEKPDSFWEQDDDFPEEFPGEKYKEIYNK